MNKLYASKAYKSELWPYLIWSVLFFLISNLSLAQVFVPRAGFPYCQPFTGSGNPNSLPFTIARGNTILNYGTGQVSPDRPLVLTGNSLELTPDSENERGYILIDLPFSSEYGIKASFEYFIYKESIGFYGDGFSFFLIDGTTTAATFQIGGVGGSLGYAPHGGNGGASYSSVGVTGGYMGIGFDVLGNFGNYQEKKFGGFHDPNQFNYSTPSSDIKFYPDAVTIRGPLQSGDAGRNNGAPLTNSPPPPPYSSYQFKEGKIVYFDPTLASYPMGLHPRIMNGSGDLYPNPTFFLGTSDQFRIASGLKPELLNCGTTLPPGYRKVFIDLFPTGNPAEPYDITVEMLVGGIATPVKVLDNVRYVGAAPSTLKVGFAASTGGSYYSKQEIRNLAVQVSSVEDAAKPVPPALFREVCIDDSNTVDFPFCVELPSSANAFIQCIQLYDTNPGPGDNDFDDDIYECGLSGFCNTRCDEQFKRLDAIVNGVKVGEFIAELDDEVEVGKFNEAQIRYVRSDPSFYGTVTAYYKIVDNFGLESDGIPITITINPLPRVSFIGTPLDPTCDGQNDGAITGVVIDNLVDDPGKYQVEFYDENGDPVNTTLVSETYNAEGYITATFDLSGLNLGSIFVRATNPSSESLGPLCANNDGLSAEPCVVEDELIFEFTQTLGTPIKLDPYRDEICESEIFEVLPTIDPIYNPNNLPVPFKWYLDENRNIELVNGINTIGGIQVEVEILSNGQLNIDGLLSNGNSPKTYSFYVETDFQDNSGAGVGNFCPYIGEVTTIAEVTVFPALQATIAETPDWCRTGAGVISVTASGGQGTVTYTLLNDSGNEISQNSTGIFSGLFPGEYTIEIETQNPTCILSRPATIEGPDLPLSIQSISEEEARCDIDNGSITFEILGGNSPFPFPASDITLTGGPSDAISFNPADETYTFTGLAPNVSYSLTVEDEKDCFITYNFTIQEIRLPVFTVSNPAQVCEDQPSIQFDVTYDFFEISATAIPTFNWYENETGGPAIENGSGPFGFNYTINKSNGQLVLENLNPGSFSLFLEMSGPDACNLPRRKVDFSINPLPEPVVLRANSALCFGGSDGLIEIGLANGIPSDFEFSLNGGAFQDNSGLFNSGISAGSYSIIVRNKATGCQENISVTVSDPAELLLGQGPVVDPTCGEDNGAIRFDIQGGTLTPGGNYGITINSSDISTFSTVTEAPDNSFLVENLAPGTYAVRVTDENGCVKEISFTLTAQEIPQFNVEDTVVCETETATLVAETILLAGSSPSFTWLRPDPSDPSNLITIANGDVVDGVTYSIVNNELRIVGLLNDDSPYSYFLQVSGDKVCPAPPISVEVRVQKIPEAVFLPSPVSCFGLSDGEITLDTIDPAGNFTFTIQENGQSNTSGTFTGLPAGQYTIRIQEDGAPCFSEEVVEITQPPLLEASEISVSAATCGEENGQLVFEVTGGTPNASGDYGITINGNPASSFGTDFTKSGDSYELVNLSPGTYTIQIRDENSCTVTLTSVIEDTPIPTFGVDDVVVCEGESATLTPLTLSNTIGASPVFNWFYEDPSATGSYIQINNGDQLGAATFQISAGILTINGLLNIGSPYTYYLGVTGDKVCPSDLIPAEVEVLKIPEAVFVPSPVSCFGLSDGEITLDSINPTGSFTFTIQENGQSNSTGNFSGLPAGQYTIRIQEDGAPCFAEEVVEITQPDELILLNEQSVNPTCGQENGSFSFDLTGGTKDYSITINGQPISNFTHSITGDRIEIRNLPPATYSLAVSDANSCSVSAPNLVSLVNDDGFEVTLEPMNQEICESAEVIFSPTLTISIPVTPTFKWYKNSTLTQPVTSGVDSDGVNFTVNNSTGEITIQNLTQGTHTFYVEISGPGICTVIESAQAVVNPPITAQTTVNNITCFGESDGSIVINPAGGKGIYQLSFNGGPFQSVFQFINLTPGDYPIQIRDEIGCTYSETITIEGPSAPIQINNPTIERASCDLNNGSIRDLQISGGWGNYTVEWRRGSVTGNLVTGTNSQAVDLAPDTYFLIVTDEGGCEESYSFVVEESSDPEYAIVPPINGCEGQNITIRPIHLAPDPTLPPAAATEVRWYKNSGQIGLIQNGPDLANPSINYTIDDSDWLNPQLLIEGLPAGDYSFYFFVVCTGVEMEINVSIYETPDVIVDTNAITCFGDSNGSLEIVSGDLPIYEYQINNGASISQAQLEALTFSAGDYQLTVSTPAGCAQVIPFTIEGPSAPLSIPDLIGVNPGCGAANGKLEGLISGGFAPYSIEIFQNGTSLSTISSLDGEIAIDGLTIGEYYLNITDREGCQITSNTIELVDGPTQILINNSEICEAQSASLTPTLDPAASGATFQWYFDQSLSQVITSSPSPATDGRIYQINNSTGVLTVTGLPASDIPYRYYVAASGTGVCAGFIGVGEILVNEIPTATYSVENEICFGEGGAITISASGGSGSYTYSLNGGAFGPDNSFDVPTGTYQVEVRSTDGCVTLINNIEVNGPSSALIYENLDAINASCELANGQIEFDLSGGYAPYQIQVRQGTNIVSQQIQSNPGRVIINQLTIGNYTFTITDQVGCVIEISNPIEIIEVPTQVSSSGDSICVGETAQVLASVPSNVTNPVYSWFTDPQGTQPINAGSFNGISYSFPSLGRMEIEGLTPSNSPYTYYVEISGVGVCGIDLIPVQVTVSQIPTLRVSNPSVVCDPNGTVDLTDYIEGFNPNIYDYNVFSPNGGQMRLDELGSVGLSGDYRVSSSMKGTACWNQPQRIRVLISDSELVANFDYLVDLGDGNLIDADQAQIFEDVSFSDLSLGNAVIWNWDFGDGNRSNTQNPTHQFTEKGTYVVNLQVVDDLGCISEYQLLINVSDEFNVMIPNAFTPAGLKNQTFRPYTRGIASMEFYIFNTWGELIYQTNSLEDLGWDGTLNGRQAPNGNYVYRGTFYSRSGEKIEKSGVFTLIR